MIASVATVPLRPSPIEPSWIREGSPQARNNLLSCSADGMASTIVWDCTAGRFDWVYDIDETIYFLDGSATIGCESFPPRSFTAGDVLFLPCGTVAHWHVETYVRKVAFCRRTQPKAIALVLNTIGKLQRAFVRPSRIAGQLLDGRIVFIAACVAC